MNNPFYHQSGKKAKVTKIEEWQFSGRLSFSGSCANNDDSRGLHFIDVVWSTRAQTNVLNCATGSRTEILWWCFAGDSVDFMSWFINALHMALNGTKKRNSSVISQTFRGQMKVTSRKMPPIEMVREHFVFSCF